MSDAVSTQGGDASRELGAKTSASPLEFSALRRAQNARFYTCLIVLGLAAIGLESSAQVLGAYFKKLSIPTKKPLYSLDPQQFRPNYVLHPRQPARLPDDLIENLGTDNYVTWNLIDRTRDSHDPSSTANLFVSYYTGKPDMVPHRPEECMGAAGYDLREQKVVEIPVPRAGKPDVKIPVSVLEFDPPATFKNVLSSGAQGAAKKVVGYFFYANGDYVTTRTGVRLKVANLTDRYAYYSKIELSFTDESGRVWADREQTIDGLRRLLPVLMPVLWNDHYQDWEAIKAGQAPVGG